MLGTVLKRNAVVDLLDGSANHKHTDLMQARAWFTRGLAALLLAGLLA